ncbi:hypothetical protein Nepgr_028231 [Nepenthes gracilis]|uniref:Protein kinase domain-containing protein n=1 Tax=Nepenthes gracilis TaxID=150966 RepID=A0AAD3TA93_NEPGR|nr:hypothetical protein Nepgr_028231 [Nepenthes gracilis]
MHMAVCMYRAYEVTLRDQSDIPLFSCFKMGCFMVLKRKKKKNEQSIHINRVLPQEYMPVTLPEPQVRSHALQSAPPSFCTRSKSIKSTNKLTKSRTHTLSAPSSFNVAEEEDALSSTECDEHEELNGHGRLSKEQRSSSPQPLPLPSPENTAAFKNTGSFKLANTSGSLYASGPLPLPPSGTLRSFSYKEIAIACHNFSPDDCISESFSSTVYKASFCDVAFSSKKLEATVTWFYPSSQVLKEFVIEVNKLASLRHPNLCKLLGYHAPNDSEQRILVYERLSHGCLDRLLHRRSDAPPIDWNSRMKVALCAAQGLTFLHEEGPFQAMYNEFSAANIQIDKDFTAKLSGYGCVGFLPEADSFSSFAAHRGLSLETLERGFLTPKSNVYSFGIVLLELLTGRKNIDSRCPKERNLVKWSWPFLSDGCRLSLIMDPSLKGRFPLEAAREVADIAQQCLRKDPSERPTMRTVSEHLKTIQDIKFSCRFPLQEPATVTRKQILRSPSLNVLASRQSFPQHSPSSHSSVCPTSLMIMPISAPPLACSTIFISDELDHRDSRKPSSSSRRASVEEF